MKTRKEQRRILPTRHNRSHARYPICERRRSQPASRHPEQREDPFFVRAMFEQEAHPKRAPEDSLNPIFVRAMSNLGVGLAPPPSSVSIPFSSGQCRTLGQVMSKWVGESQSLFRQGNVELQGEAAVAAAAGLNPFFVRAMSNVGGVVFDTGFQGLNPFFVRAMFEQWTCNYSSGLRCLNPFFVRAMFERSSPSPPPGRLCLNPFFVRAMFEQKGRGIPSRSRVSIPFSSGQCSNSRRCLSRPVSGSQSLFRQGNVRTVLLLVPRCVPQVSIPFSSGQCSNNRLSKLLPAAASQSLFRQGNVRTARQSLSSSTRRLNPFFVRAMFERNQSSIRGEVGVSQSLFLQGNVRTKDNGKTNFYYVSQSLFRQGNVRTRKNESCSLFFGSQSLFRQGNVRTKNYTLRAAGDGLNPFFVRAMFEP